MYVCMSVLCIQTWPGQLLGLALEEFSSPEEPRGPLREVSSYLNLHPCASTWLKRVSLRLRSVRLGTARKATIWPTSALSPCSPFPKLSSPSSYQMEEIGKKGLSAAGSKQERVTPPAGKGVASPSPRRGPGWAWVQGLKERTLFVL